MVYFVGVFGTGVSCGVAFPVVVPVLMVPSSFLLELFPFVPDSDGIGERFVEEAGAVPS